jgi:hypothetical protein
MHPVVTSVERGGEGEILLEAIPVNGNDIKFNVKDPPSHGSLGQMHRKSPNAVSLTYTNNGDKDTSDAFTFRIKASGKSWTTCEALITITDPPDSLQLTPAVLDFGKVGVGEAPSKKILLKNRLAGAISGTLMIPSPWRVDGDGRYNLRLGESAEFTIFYEPHAVTESVATVNLLPSGNGPKLTLKGDSVNPFEISPESLELHPGSTLPEETVTSCLDHPMMVKVVTDDLMGVIPAFSLKPHEVRRIHLREVQHPIKEMDTKVRFVVGDYDAEVTIKIFPPLQPTNQVAESVQTKKVDKKSVDPPEEPLAGKATKVTVVQLPTNMPTMPPSRVGMELPNVPTGPILLPEKEQEQLRRLMVRDLSYFLKRGWIGWRLTLQWRYDDPPPKEFLIEEKLLVSGVKEEGSDAGSVEYQRVKPHWVKSHGNGIWQASVPSPPMGFHFLRIAPVLDGTDKTIWASFQVEIPSQSLIWDQYRGPFALLLVVILVILVLRMMGRW